MIIISPTGKGCVDEVFEGSILEVKGESERGRERETEREIRAKHHLRRLNPRRNSHGLACLGGIFFSGSATSYL